MKIQDDEKFIRVVENLVIPSKVSELIFFSGFKKLVPNSVFKRMLEKISKKSPYMGFIIDPYATFLFFKLKDIEKAKSYLPRRYELTKTKIFDDEEPEHYLGMGIFNTRASTFWGSRLEVYLIAKDKETGHPSWIFLDILSDTLIAIPKEGVVDKNCTKAMITTSSKGDLIIDFKEDPTDRQLTLKGNIGNGKIRPLYQPIWIAGNTSIGHRKDWSEKNDDPFAVIFDPAEVENALDIPLEDVHLTKNTLFPGMAESELCKVLCFPFTQHYIADSPGRRTYIKDNKDMIENYNKISNLNDIKTFSTKGIKRMLVMGMVLPILSSIILFILLMMNL